MRVYSPAVEAAVDAFYAVDPPCVSDESRALAREQAQTLLGIVKARTRSDRIVTCIECAKRLDISQWVVKGLAKRNEVWSGRVGVYSERGKREYQTVTVDVDEVRAVLAKREKREPAQPIIIETPPAGWISIKSLRLELGMLDNTLGTWCRRGDIQSKKYLVNGKGNRRFWHRYVPRAEAIELFKRKLAHSRSCGGNMKRDTKIPSTPFIDALWATLHVDSVVAGAWRELRR